MRDHDSFQAANVAAGIFVSARTSEPLCCAVAVRQVDEETLDNTLRDRLTQCGFFQIDGGNGERPVVRLFRAGTQKGEYGMHSGSHSESQVSRLKSRSAQ